MGLLDEFMAYMDANTPRSTRPAVSPLKVIDQGLLGSRIEQMPQRADEIKQGLLRAPADLKQLGGPEMNQQVQGAYANPSPEGFDREKGMQMAMDFLQTSTPVGGLAGMFIGKGAKTWDALAAQQADDLLAKGIDPRDVWKQTGTMKGVDGALRQEIPDNAAAYKSLEYTPDSREFADQMRARGFIQQTKKSLAEHRAAGGKMEDFYDTQPGLYDELQTANRFVSGINSKMNAPKSGVIGDVLQHEPLFDAYGLRDMPVRYADADGSAYMPNLGGRPGVEPGSLPGKGRIFPVEPGDGTFATAQNSASTKLAPAESIAGSIQLQTSLGNNAGKSTTLHELQHAIQQREGWARGGSPDGMIADVADARYKLGEIKQKMTRLQDEAESRARMMVNSPSPEDAQFINSAVNKWTGKLGAKSDSNPFGVTPEDAVKFELIETEGIVGRLGQQRTALERLASGDQMDAYKRLAGEAEARLTQSRMGLDTAQRLQHYPYDQGQYGLDVPLDSLIVRGLLNQ